MYKYSRFSYFKHSKGDFLGLFNARNLVCNHSAGDALIYVKEKKRMYLYVTLDSI